MAIKVNGTTVINDSRALSNIASVDATTVAAMSAAGVGATEVPVSGGWLGWTTQSAQLFSFSTGQETTYTIPSDGWYKLTTPTNGSTSNTGSISFNLSRSVSWYRIGNQNRAYERIGIGTNLYGNWWYDNYNKFSWLVYLYANDTVSHYALNNAGQIYRLT